MWASPQNGPQEFGKLMPSNLRRKIMSAIRIGNLEEQLLESQSVSVVGGNSLLWITREIDRRNRGGDFPSPHDFRPSYVVPDENGYGGGGGFGSLRNVECKCL
jgi:hypothetical protein